MWPVFEWLCRLCEVVIKLAPVRLAAIIPAVAPVAAAETVTSMGAISNADADVINTVTGHAATPTNEK